MNFYTATETAYKNGYAQGVADTRAKFSTIYVLHFADQDNYAAYTSLKKAKEVMWECYCEDYDEVFRAQYAEEDKVTLEDDNYISDYAWISQVDLFDEEGKRVR